MLDYLYVALGSAAGGVARWSVGNWVQRLGGRPASGGVPRRHARGERDGLVRARPPRRLAHASRRGARTEIMWLLLGVGFCGGYTTFSTFSLDTVALLETRGGIAAAVNVVASVSAGLIGVVAGMLLGRAALARLA